jgi:hypothetical protein
MQTYIKICLTSFLLLISNVAFCQPPPPPPVEVPLDGFSGILLISALTSGLVGIYKRFR